MEVRAELVQDMKLLYDTLDAMLAELARVKVSMVRVGPLIQADGVVAGAATPAVSVRIVVTALIDERFWAEWRLWIGRTQLEVEEDGFAIPERLRRRTEQRLVLVQSRVEAAGFRLLEGVLAPDGAAMDTFRP
ncbi:MAG TPA: hypothetical protein VNI83_01010 [Vicinamibacterales bacterium]|nr:hypothetical protein [Vicinamibacterales bacterium]